MTIQDIRVGLRAILLQDSAITALAGTRIYPTKLPQGVVDPSIVYTRISGQGDHHMGGPSGLSRVRMQIVCWATSASSAVNLANAVKNYLDGFRGTVLWGDNSPPEAIDVRGVFYESERDLYDDVLEMHGMSRDYIIWHAEL